MDVARDDQELLVVTENGYGKRTRIDQYRKTSRGAKGVKTIGLTESKGALGGALVVREHQELVFISQNGLVQRTGVRGISQQGRAATGVRVMNIRDDDKVSAIALVIESDEPDAPSVTDDIPADAPPIDVAAEAPLGAPSEPSEATKPSGAAEPGDTDAEADAGADTDGDEPND
jgi:DNA gyrase subunit A